MKKEKSIFINIPLFKLLIAVPLLSLFCLQAYSQDSNVLKTISVVVAKNDSIPLPPYPPTKKRFWRASGELMLAQVIPWAYNYYVRDAEFAHISWESIGNNLKFSSWGWDDNNFKTNQFAHPYHGNLYFSAFRSNGYSFWQSAPAAFAGSYMWEVAGETHPPAINDFINTSLGGISLGEMSYRLSNLVVNNKERGFKRQAREVAAFLVNPMNGLNRIIDGKWGKRMENPPDRKPSKVVGEYDMGARRFSEKVDDVLEKGKNEWYFRLRLLYGSPFEDRKTAFSNFSFTMELGNNDSAKINTARVSGFLCGWELGDTVVPQHVINITANYDYYKNSSFNYGGQSINANLLSRFKTGKKTRVETRAAVGAIVLAAVQDEHLYYGEGRDYDYGPGVGFSGDVNLFAAEKFLLGLHYQGGWFTTVNGNPSSHLLNAFTTELRYFFTKSFSLGAEWGHLNLKGYFRDYPDVNHIYPYARVSAGYKYNF